MIRLLTRAQLQSCVGFSQESLSAIEKAFVAIAFKQVQMPPITRLDFPSANGEVDIKTATLPGEPTFAIKVASGFYDNFKRGLDSTSGLMLLISTATGEPVAALFDNGYLTQIRTALAGAIAAKYLAAEEIETVGVIGSGAQAQFQIEALHLARSFKRVHLFSRHQDRRDQAAVNLRKKLSCPVEAFDTAEAVVKSCQLLITATPSTEPIVKEAWLAKGLHITAMGSDAEHKQELEAKILAKADLYACDSLPQVRKLGELHHALKAGFSSLENTAIELGHLIAKTKTGRTHPDQITVCDLTGTGAQDTAIAQYALQKCELLGLGSAIDVNS